MKKKFKVGDTVRLKAGGANMTVSDTPDTYNSKLDKWGYEGNVSCRWFKKDNVTLAPLTIFNQEELDLITSK